MLNNLLDRLDMYNVEVGTKESELKRAVLDVLKEFYNENRVDLEEADKLAEEAIKSNPPIGRRVDLETILKAGPGMLNVKREESPERRAYAEKGALLVEKLNQKLSVLSVTYLGHVYSASEALQILNLDIENFRVEPTFFINPDAPLAIHGLEDHGYEILCRAIGKILMSLVPDTNYNATYWGGRTDYISRFFGHGKWKHLGLEGQTTNPFGVVHVKHNIGSPEKPFPDSSEDVAIIKTLGGIETRDHEMAYKRFWEKMTDNLKVGGILVSSYELPEEFKDHYQQITNLGGSGRDFLGFNSVTTRGTHYFPTRIYFFQKVA